MTRRFERSAQLKDLVGEDLVGWVRGWFNTTVSGLKAGGLDQLRDLTASVDDGELVINAHATGYSENERGYAEGTETYRCPLEILGADNPGKFFEDHLKRERAERKLLELSKQRQQLEDKIREVEKTMP